MYLPLPLYLLFSCVNLSASRSVARFAAVGPPRQPSTVSVSATTPDNHGIPLDAFVSFSIEFSSFPDFAGNASHPNTFSNNLLNNLGNLTGTKPYIRVGGNTQDYAVFNKSLLDLATVGIFKPEISKDYPRILHFGPKYFESYHTWPDVRFIHGFNLGKNSSHARKALIESVPYACKALGGGKLLHWELGNEPDLFSTSSQGPVRPPNWNEKWYVRQWLHWTREIRDAMKEPCPNLPSKDEYTYYGGSFATTSATLDPIITWQDGLDADKDIAIISQHNYINGATEPGVTLQGTLMNHSSNIESVSKLLNESRLLAALPYNKNPNLPFILGETNSLYNEGRPGLSNTFGAALWGVDFNLWCATHNIRRVHMHQGTNYCYQAWQPIETSKASKGTKAPYYGSIAVAAFMGDITTHRPSIANLPLPNEEESAYAAYIAGKLDRIMVINMMEYNATAGNKHINHYPRPIERYEFQLPKGWHGKAEVQRLMANGSDAITGCTFDAYSYNYELKEGVPVRLHNVTRDEHVTVGKDGKMTLDVPRSSAAIVKFSKGG